MGKDVDGDGDIDLMASSFANPTQLHGTKTMAPKALRNRTLTTSASGATCAVYASDLDSDGDVDILAASASNDTILGLQIRN